MMGSASSHCESFGGPSARPSSAGLNRTGGTCGATAAAGGGGLTVDCWIAWAREFTELAIPPGFADMIATPRATAETATEMALCGVTQH